MPTTHFFAFHWLCFCFPLATCPSSVLWAYASATIISSTGCTCFHHNNCGHGDISAITLLILSLSGCNPVNILWYTAPVDMMTFRWSLRSYQSICQQHPPYSHPQVTLIYYTTFLFHIFFNSQARSLFVFFDFYSVICRHYSTGSLFYFMFLFYLFIYLFIFVNDLFFWSFGLD